MNSRRRLGGNRGSGGRLVRRLPVAEPLEARHVLSAVALTAPLTEPAAIPLSDDPDPVGYLETEKNLVAGVRGLDGAEASITSPDGRHVYVASITNNAVTLFDRDTLTGAVTYRAVYQSGVNGISFLRNAHSLVISPDGLFLYVSARRDNAVTVLARNPIDGTLTFVQSLQDGQNGVDGLRYPGVVTLSPDAKHLYITGRYDNALAQFARDEVTGRLTYLRRYVEGQDGIDGLRYPRGVEVSPDGRNVYATSMNGDGLAVFARDPFTGRLTFLEVEKNNVAGVKGLGGSVTEVQVSPDGNSVFTVSSNNSALSVFRRDPLTGRLTFQEWFTQGMLGVSGMSGAISVDISPDNRRVAVAAYNSSSLVEFDRDPTTGEVTFERATFNGTAGVTGMGGAHGVSYSGDGKTLYVSAFLDDALVVFQVPPTLPDAPLAAREAMHDAGLLSVLRERWDEQFGDREQTQRVSSARAPRAAWPF